jgi:hypothetical protein
MSTTPLRESRRDGGWRGRLQLGWGHWLLITLSLCLIVLLCFWGFVHPSYFLHDCEHHYLPSVEERLGFKGGRLRLPGRDDAPYALLEVDPAGPLGRAGFRSGDVPVFQHGGLAAFCGAIRSAEDGYDAEVQVISGHDADNSQRRSVTIPPMPEWTASGFASQIQPVPPGSPRP